MANRVRSPHYGPECSKNRYCLLGGQPTHAGDIRDGICCPYDSCDLEQGLRGDLPKDPLRPQRRLDME